MVDVCHDGDIPEIHFRIISVRSADHENERLPSLEAQPARQPQTEEKVLPQQAALQEVSGRGQSGAQGQASRDN
jgi:hypothetical protein